MYDGPRPDPKIAGTCGKSGTYQVRNAFESKEPGLGSKLTVACTRPIKQPMQKKGAIILATGGDESISAQGNFYEGFMATGDASEATDAAVQQNILSDDRLSVTRG